MPEQRARKMPRHRAGAAAIRLLHAKALLEPVLEDLGEVDSGTLGQIVEVAWDGNVLADRAHIVGPAVGVEINIDEGNELSRLMGRRQGGDRKSVV